MYYATQGRRTEAVTLAERAGDAYEAIPCDENNIWQMGELADLYIKLGDSAKAEGLLRRILAVRGARPADPFIVHAEVVLATAFEKEGQGPKSAAARRQAETLRTQGNKS